MPITKQPPAGLKLMSDDEWKEIQLPGRLGGADLYVLDVMLLPRENSIAVFALGPKAMEAAGAGEPGDQKRRDAPVAGLAKNVAGTLEALPMALLDGSEATHLKCAVVKPEMLDGNCFGGDSKLLCRVVGLDVAEAVRKAQKASSGTLRVLLGSEVVQVSARTLSAAKYGQHFTRDFRHNTTATAESSSGLQVSVVLPLYGKFFPYMTETMRYFQAVGLSHVYIGLFDEDKPGLTRSTVAPFIEAGFVSVLELDAWPHFAWNRSRIESVKSLLNDWALFHAKSFDDLMIIHDYDELMVPLAGKSLPDTMAHILQATSTDLENLCFITACPVVTYGPRGRKIEERSGASRAEDFPFSDGGVPGYQWKPCTPGTKGCEFLNWHECTREGYAAIYPKSMAVVRTSYSTTVHQPGSCSVVDFEDVDPLKRQHAGTFMILNRSQGLVVQHFTEMLNPGRYVPDQDHTQVKSPFTQVWWPRVKASAGGEDAAP